MSHVSHVSHTGIPITRMRDINAEITAARNTLVDPRPDVHAQLAIAHALAGILMALNELSGNISELIEDVDPGGLEEIPLGGAS